MKVNRINSLFKTILINSIYFCIIIKVLIIEVIVNL